MLNNSGLFRVAVYLLLPDFAFLFYKGSSMKTKLVLIFILFCALTNAYALIRSYSKETPDIPVERDNVVIETYCYLISGKIISFNDSIKQNDINICIFASDSSVPTGYSKEIHKFDIGNLNSGKYRILTTSKYIRSRRNPIDTIIDAKDTTLFQVLPDSISSPRIVNYKFISDYVYVSDATPKRSYYYWNGDTLSIGMAFYDPSTHRQFIPRIGLNSDTLILDLIDTSYNVAPAFNGYLTITSLSNVPPGNYLIKIRNLSWSAYGKSVTNNFYSLSANNDNIGIGLGFKNIGQTEFILCLNDTQYMECYIISPFLDTLRLFNFQPNPFFKPLKKEDIFMQNISYNGTIIEDWEAYNKNEWHYNAIQESDSIVFDTISNNTNSDHWMHLNFSNTNGNPFKGYLYKTLTSEYIDSSPNPFLSILCSIKEPISIINPILRQPNLESATLRTPLVRYLGAYLSVEFPNRYKKTNTVTITIFNIQGKKIRALCNEDIHFIGNRIVANWNRKDINGNPVQSGLFILRLLSQQESDHTTLIIK